MNNTLVHIAIPSETLTSLLQQGQLHAVDFQCLNTESKRVVWQCLLQTVKIGLANTVKPNWEKRHANG